MQSKQKKVLIVDDEADILEFLEIILTEEGYAVTTSAQGDNLKRMTSHGFPDLILLDMLLSGKDGREIARYFKGQQETRHIPVIMFSAHPGARESALKAGADGFISKPFNIDELLSMLVQYG
jgi:CheY-like chemotaxis protein